MATCFVGGKVAFGTGQQLLNAPINNLPPDTISVRRRLRHNDIAQAFVKTSRGTFRYYLEWDGPMRLKVAGYFAGSNTRETLSIKPND